MTSNAPGNTGKGHLDAFPQGSMVMAILSEADVAIDFKVSFNFHTADLLL